MGREKAVGCEFSLLICAFFPLSKVFDCRHIETTQEMYEAIRRHIAYGNNGGNLRWYREQDSISVSIRIDKKVMIFY